MQCVFLQDPKKRKEDHDVIIPELRGSGVAAVGDGNVSASSSSQSPPRQVLPLSSLLGPIHSSTPLGIREVSSHSELELEVASTLSSSLGSTSNGPKPRVRFGIPSKSIPLLGDNDSAHSHSEENNLQRSISSSPTPFAGVLTQINGMHGAYVKDSMRNAELWNFCLSNQPLFISNY